jgi:DNA-binding NarL/FixJ family response regulator
MLDCGTSSGRQVLVVEDDDLCRTLISDLLERIGCVVHATGRGDTALEIARAARPALAIVDVNLPHVTGYEVCRQLREAFGDALAIMFVSGDRVEGLDRVAGFSLGADDYLVKPFEPDELLARARLLLKRQPAPLEVPHERRRGTATSSLTARERDVLVLLAHGRDQKQIAGELVISPKTVATHIQRILGKLDVKSRAQAVAVAHRERLVTAL